MKNSDPEAITIGCVSQNLTPPTVLLLLRLFYCATSGAVQSTVGFVKSRKSIKEIPMVHEGWPGHHFALHHYACSITIGVDSISSIELSGLSGSPSLASQTLAPYDIWTDGGSPSVQMS